VNYATDGNPSTFASIQAMLYPASITWDLGGTYTIDGLYLHAGATMTFKLLSSANTVLAVVSVSDVSGASYQPVNEVAGVRYVTLEAVGLPALYEVDVRGLLESDAAPGMPAGVLGVGESEQARLSWTANKETDIAGYNVYRDGAKVNADLIIDTAYTVTGLADGTPYSLAVSAVDRNGNESAKSAQTVTAGAFAPLLAGKPSTSEARVADPQFATDGDSATYATMNGSLYPATMTWDLGGSYKVNGVSLHASGAMRFHLASATNVVLKTITVTDVSGSGFQEFAEVDGVRFVTVEATGLPKLYEAEVRGLFVSDAAPGTPSGLLGVGEDGQVRLTWKANKETDIAGYNVYRDNVKVNDDIISSAAFTVTGLANGTSYHFAVSAVDRNGNESTKSSQSVTAGDYLPLLTGKESTTDVRVVDAALATDGDPTTAAVFQGSLYPGTMSWDLGGSYTINGAYLHASAPINLHLKSADNVTLRTLSITDSSGSGGLRDIAEVRGVRYIVAEGGGLPQLFELQVRGLFEADASPAAPTGLLAIGDSGRAVVTWSSKKEIDVTGYNLYLNGARINSELLTETNYIAEGLHNGHTYSFAVSAVDASGNESLKAAQSATVGTYSSVLAGKDATSGFLVTNPALATDGNPSTAATFSGFTGYTASATWDLGGDYTVNGAYMHAGFPMTLQFRSASNAVLLNLAITDTVGSGVVHRMKQVTGVRYVTAALAYNTSLYELKIWALSESDGPPESPTGLTATAGDTVVTLAWDANLEEDVTSYNVYRDGVRIATVTGLSYTAEGLENGVEYVFTVTAVDANGNESFASSETSATPEDTTPEDTTPPAAPRDLIATTGAGRATLAWTPNTEADLAGYRVYLDGSLTATVTEATYVAYALDAGSNYTFEVTAFDVNDNESGRSNPVTVTMAPPPGNGGASTIRVYGDVRLPPDVDAEDVRIRIDSLTLIEGEAVTVAEAVYGEPPTGDLPIGFELREFEGTQYLRAYADLEPGTYDIYIAAAGYNGKAAGVVIPVDADEPVSLLSEDSPTYVWDGIDVPYFDLASLPRLTGLQVDEPLYRLDIGESRQISVAAIYDHGSVDVASQAIYITSDPNIVQVASGGLVTVHGSGEATVTIRFGEYEETIRVWAAFDAWMKKLLDPEDGRPDISDIIEHLRWSQRDVTGDDIVDRQDVEQLLEWIAPSLLD